MIPAIVCVTVAALLLCPIASAGDRSLFVLHYDSSNSGIMRVDPDSGQQSPFASFLYCCSLSGPNGGQSLAALPDRVVVQGVAFYEFDIRSGQVLRRYPSLVPPYATWSFQGVAVDVAAAKQLGIEPGYYGSPVCTRGPEGDFCRAPLVPFPGHERKDTWSSQHALLHRGLDAAGSDLRLIKTFTSDDYFGARRFTSVDVDRGRFWFWIQTLEGKTNSAVQRLTSAPITDGAVGDESLIRETRIPFATASAEERRSASSFAYDGLGQYLLHTFRYDLLHNETRLTRAVAEGQEVVLTRDQRGQLEAVAVRPPSKPPSFIQLLPGIGETRGVNGTDWRSDAWLFNPSDAPMGVTLRRVTKPEMYREIELGSHASIKLDNVLAQFGGGPSGDGTTFDALLIETPYRDKAQLSVYSRTYTKASGGGTYGQSVPAVMSPIGYSNHMSWDTPSRDMSETNSVILLDKRDPKQFRHNLGVVNPSDVPVTILLRYAGNTLETVVNRDSEAVLKVPARSVRQFNLESLFPAYIVQTWAPEIAVAADRPVALSLSMIDNVTGDASFIPFTFYSIDVPETARLAFPAIARTAGANGSRWQTDMYGVFGNALATVPSQKPQANFYGPANCSTATMTLNPSAGFPDPAGVWPTTWYTAFSDVTRQACPEADSVTGALEVRTGSWMSAVARTYTTRDDGGTYGDILPLYPPRGWPSRHFSGIELNDAFRVNIGLYNGFATPVDLELRLYRDDGSLAASKTVTTAAKALLQNGLRQFFGTELPDGLYGLSVLPLNGAEGCWPYISVVDNVTNDPTNFW